MSVTPKNPWPEEDIPVEVDERRKKIVNWRLEEVTKAYKRNNPGMIDFEEARALHRLAHGDADLTTMRKAFEAGCTLGQALSIFL